MKKQIVLLAAFVILAGLTLTYGQVDSKEKHSLSKKAVENLLKGLKSDNYGLRTSCAYFIGIYKVTSANEQLVNMFQNEESDEGRIVAVLALHSINDEVGNSAIEYAAGFDKSEQVRSICKILQKYGKH